MVEERRMVDEVHACAEEDQQDDGDDGFFAGHKYFTSNYKENASILQPGCKLEKASLTGTHFDGEKVW